MATSSYESARQMAESLSREDQLRLIRELVAGAEKTGDRSIMELSGLGAEIWNGIDAQEYVRGQRDSWNAI